MEGELRLVDDVPDAFTEVFVEAWEQRAGDRFAVALCGGPTARRCYERLAKEADRIDWSAVDVYWGDERCVPLDHPDSNYRLAREALLEQLDAVGSVHPMICDDGPDAYQQRLVDVGQLDLVHLGLGADGHTASLFPGSPALGAPVDVLVARNHDPQGNNPHDRLTFTFHGIAHSRQVVVATEGEEKRDALTRLRAGADLPAGRIRSAGSVRWLADPSAVG